METRGRKKIKYGSNITLHLGNETIAKLKKMASGKSSGFVEALINKEWAKKQASIEKDMQEAQEILSDQEVLA